VRTTPLSDSSATAWWHSSTPTTLPPSSKPLDVFASESTPGYLSSGKTAWWSIVMAHLAAGVQAVARHSKYGAITLGYLIMRIGLVVR
jgi:hypothetical protein